LSVFLVSRWLWIVANPQSSAYWEEAYRWVAVESLAGGAGLPFSEYQADHYQGGSLVVIGLAALLRAVGVDSLVALKLVALLFSGATLVVLFLVGRVFFGRLVALICGLIYLLGPPLVAFWGVVAMGFHAESVLLSLCIVGVFLALVDDIWSGPCAWLCLGIVSGLAIWFTPTVGVSVAACVLAWPRLAKIPKASLLLVAVAGFCLGSTPWLAYNVVNDFAGLDRILEVFGARSSVDPWRSQGLGARAGDLLLRAPTQGLLDPGGDYARPWPAFVLYAGVWLPAGVALAAAMRRAWPVLWVGRAHGDDEARRELVFVAYAPLFAVAYLASRFTLDIDPSPIAYRLFVPLAVFLVPPIAISAARGLRAGGMRGRCSAIGCAVALTSLCAATSTFALWHAEPGTPLSFKQGYVVWGRLLNHKHGRDIRAAADDTRHIATAPDRNRILRGIGWGIQNAYEQRGDISDVSRSLENVPAADREIIVKGLEWALDIRRDYIAAALRRGEDPDLRRVLTRLDSLAEWVTRRGGRRAPTARDASPSASVATRRVFANRW
jgi:hypothetical protein